MTACIAALAQLKEILGPKGFSQDSEEMAPWLTDWRGRYHGRAAAMLSPANSAEVAQIVKVAAAHRLALVPQGGNSGMVGGATPDESGTALLVSLRRMNAIISVSPDDRLVTCQAGVILQTLHDELAQHGQRFPLTLGGKGSATVGGLISTNAGGTQVLRHGTMRALVAGVEAVLPDGSIYDGMAPLKKDNRGYDIKQLLIGGEGTIGIVTAATLKTVPALVDRAVAWCGVASPVDATRLLRFCEARAGAALEGFELIADSCLDAVLRHIPGTRAPLGSVHRWHVLIELARDDISAEPPEARCEALLAEAIEENLVADAAISQNEAQAEAFWKLRDMIAEAERADGPALQHDISVPVSAMAEFITASTAAVEARFPGTEVAAFGHLGDGNIHYHVKAPAGVDAAAWQAEAAKTVSPFVYDLVNAAGGSISAEHGIGQNKLAELARLSDPARLHALAAIKHAFDPDGIMNPGKLVQLAPSRCGS